MKTFYIKSWNTWCYTVSFFTIIPAAFLKDQQHSSHNLQAETSPLAKLSPNVLIFAPFIGIFTGSSAALFAHLMLAAGASSLITAILTTCILIYLSGGLHEDGLADYIDSIGCHASKERKLAIMRDSSIGTFGAIGLFIFLSLIVVSLSEILTKNTFEHTLLINYVIAIEIAARAWFASAACIFKAPHLSNESHLTNGIVHSNFVLVWPKALIVLMVSYASIIALTDFNTGIAIGIVQLIVFAIWSIFNKQHLGFINGDCFGALLMFQRLSGLVLLTIIL